MWRRIRSLLCGSDSLFFFNKQRQQEGDSSVGVFVLKTTKPQVTLLGERLLYSHSKEAEIHQPLPTTQRLASVTLLQYFTTQIDNNCQIVRKVRGHRSSLHRKTILRIAREYTNNFIDIHVTVWRSRCLKNTPFPTPPFYFLLFFPLLLLLLLHNIIITLCLPYNMC